MMASLSAQMVDLTHVNVRAPTERGKPTAFLTNLHLQLGSGVHAIVGAPRDGTSLLLSVIDGAIAPRAGARVFVVGGTPAQTRSHISRVSLEAPLPESLRVAEVCRLSAELRGEQQRPATERLAILGLESLAARVVATLSMDERRAVTMAIALTSQKTDVILIEEPLAGLETIAPRRVIDALRTRAASACVIVTTASPRDAARLGDRFFMLTNGTLAPIHPDHLVEDKDAAGATAATMRVVVAPTAGARGAAKLIAMLTPNPAVKRIESTNVKSGAVVLAMAGGDLAALARAVTQAIAQNAVDIELVEAGTLSLDAVRQALAARAASPPPGSLPPPPATTTAPAPASIPPAPAAPPVNP